ncbi:monocopper oxidase-like protein SKS1 [Vicia villosa]|uniref:monocopper oxidase-like protein SKS1 n=1 Tax=Vicia villosa TaxID=3911 RepID=UPI00273B2ACF|nr:monocopper oxidase-like protein SKS1 [Vicia villosa]
MGLFTFSQFSLNLLFLHITLFSTLCFSGDPTLYQELHVSYTTLSPLGVPQQVIAVNGKFPGPVINVTTNNHVVVNVFNQLDEELLITWPGIQMRRDSWQDGVLGTNCPIPPKWNWTYEFQVKDQIGSFFYFPSTKFQRASGGFGPFVINNRVVIPIPFAQPDGEIFIMIGDWFTQNHTALRTALDGGKELGIPDGVLINGKGPYQYNDTLVPNKLPFETITVEPGKTYRIRVHNVGVSTSLNFRIQNHNLLLAETEGYYTMQTNFTNFDIHAGQSYSFLLSTDQNASTDYYIVASARFVNESLWQKVTGVAVLHYTNSKGTVTGPLPPPPDDFYNKGASMNQARSIRQNTSSSGARPNPQGSYRYGSINITDTYLLNVTAPVKIKGTTRASINGISFLKPDVPFLLADKHQLRGIYKLDFPSKPLNRTPVVDRSIINATYKGFIEIVFQNNDTTVQNFHLDGYSFFVVGMDYGDWTENSRNSYNKWDAISRSTTQVFPGGWTAILVSLDNVGLWNLRSENLDRWYLGQETYLRILNPEESSGNDTSVPDNVLYCGPLKHLQKEQKPSSASALGHSFIFTLLLGILCVIFTAS